MFVKVSDSTIATGLFLGFTIAIVTALFAVIRHLPVLFWPAVAAGVAAAYLGASSDLAIYIAIGLPVGFWILRGAYDYRAYGDTPAMRFFGNY